MVLHRLTTRDRAARRDRALGPDPPDAAGPDPPDAVVRRLLDGDRSVLGSRAPDAPSSIAGIEQEYAVWVGDRQVDFADLVDRVVPSEAVARFAFDDTARIVRSGAIWTVDAPHAEVASAPRSLGQASPARSRTMRSASERPSARRVAAVTHGRLLGYSTHLNAFADGVDGWDLAEWFAARYAPAVMLLTERAGSPGLLVRPRPQRLEIGRVPRGPRGHRRGRGAGRWLG